MSTRETHLYELALEWAFRVTYDQLRAEASRTMACTELDLLQLGHRVLHDAARLARGEIATIELPSRLPYPGEHAPPPPAACGDRCAVATDGTSR